LDIVTWSLTQVNDNEYVVGFGNKLVVYDHNGIASSTRLDGSRSMIDRLWRTSMIPRLATAAMFVLASHATMASDFPSFQIERICRAAPRLLATDPDPYPRCTNDERGARAQLEQQWARFRPDHRQLCVRETMLDGTPSYVEVLTCLEMYAARR
jgi:hypothetical protein